MLLCAFVVRKSIAAYVFHVISRVALSIRVCRLNFRSGLAANNKITDQTQLNTVFGTYALR